MAGHFGEINQLMNLYIGQFISNGSEAKLALYRTCPVGLKWYICWAYKLGIMWQTGDVGCGFVVFPTLILHADCGWLVSSIVGRLYASDTTFSRLSGTFGFCHFYLGPS